MGRSGSNLSSANSHGSGNIKTVSFDVLMWDSVKKFGLQLFDIYTVVYIVTACSFPVLFSEVLTL